jgi:hypothetical protein
MQDACSITNATGVHGHIDNLLLHLRRLPDVGILQQEGATRTALLTTAVALLALTGLPMADNISALTVGAVQDLDDHCASLSCRCFGSSHLGIDRSTSTPLRHLRRKFTELEEVFPDECAVVTEALRQVFDHEEEARRQQMSAEARLGYHQQYSGPIMAQLKHWLDAQFAERTVEPNSSLGKAFHYLLSHWQTLTRFLEVPGAPLENNTAERALKLAIRQRKNSLFYKTDYSAYIASMLTSLIATCLHAGVNALDYLVALQEHRAAVFDDPAAWLPWNYQTHVASP